MWGSSIIIEGDYDDDNGCSDSVVTSVDISIVQCPPGTRQKAGNYPPRSAARLHLYTLHFTHRPVYGHFLSDYLLFNICVHFLQFKGELISIFEHFILSTFTTIAPEYEVHTSCLWISRYLPSTYLSQSEMYLHPSSYWSAWTRHCDRYSLMRFVGKQEPDLSLTGQDICSWADTIPRYKAQLPTWHHLALVPAFRAWPGLDTENKWIFYTGSRSGP